MTRRLIYLMLLAATLVAGCKSDDDDEQPVVEAPKGPTVQAMVVFAPGQLGDNGYADRVMSGIHGLEELSTTTFADSLDVDFISEQSFATTQAMLKAWVANPKNPLYGNEFSRRLLVLTESYMLGWLTDVKDQLRAGDEVLVLKTSADDIEAQTSLGLGSRLHGMNISAADAARKYCNFITSKMQEKRWSMDETGEMMQFWMFRLYPDYEYTYCDSIYEVFDEELNASGEIDMVDTPISLMQHEGLLSSTNPEESAMQAAYDAAENMMYYSSAGFGFCYVDLGAASMGYDYFLLNQGQDEYYSLMLDAKPNFLGRFVVERLFGKALVQWAKDWLMQPAGNMPAHTLHGQWDGYCTNTVPES